MTMPRSLCFSLCALTLIGCLDPESMGASPRERSAGSVERGAFSGRALFVEDENEARTTADEWRSSDPDGAAIMDELGDVPLALWLGDWMNDVADEVDDAVTRAGDALQVFVVYDIPNRDCGSMSAGGAGDVAAYEDFVQGVADGLDGRLALVILEPDGLALDDCLNTDGRNERHGMMADAVETLSDAGAAVYIDAGKSGWIDPEDMADRLLAAGVGDAAGFALNVAHTETTADEAAYAGELRAILGNDVRYVVDTGRNGAGAASGNEWCNPLDVENGHRPTLDTKRAGLDGLLWIKQPGSSDGWCNGGPAPGTWWPEYARDLAD